MKPLTRNLTMAILLAAPVALGACSSDEAATPATDLVATGTPLTITEPALVNDVAIIGTIQNETERTFEITSAATSAGEVEFRSADGSLLASITIGPESDFALVADGVRLELVEATTDDTVDVVLDLDIQPHQLEFTAEREGE